MEAILLNLGLLAMTDCEIGCHKSTNATFCAILVAFCGILFFLAALGYAPPHQRRRDCAFEVLRPSYPLTSRLRSGFWVRLRLHRDGFNREKAEFGKFLAIAEPLARSGAGRDLPRRGIERNIGGRYAAASASAYLAAEDRARRLTATRSRR